jgi:hypothetical protein
MSQNIQLQAQDMSEQNVSPDHHKEGQVFKEDFLNREEAEVYLLLDFLSGRADRSLRPSSDEQARSLLQEKLNTAGRLPAAEPGADEKLRKEIEDDLADPTRLVLRTMEIKYPIRKQDLGFHANAAFLIRARDVLNTRAAPATGATIAFTSMVAAQQVRGRPVASGGIVTAPGFAESAYPGFGLDARQLEGWIRRRLRVMWVVFGLAVLLSGYTAWGKVILDTLDAVRHDDKATQQELAARTSAANIANPPGPGDAQSTVRCDPGRVDRTDPNDVCNRRDDIISRNDVTHRNLAVWESPLRDIPLPWPVPAPGKSADPQYEQKATEQWATAALTVLGNYVMPILYGYLGSLAFVLRRFHDRLTAHLLSPRDLRANAIRLRLGALIGGCIGLVYSGSGAAQTQGMLGLAVTLSTSAIAFLAGYGVEGVFRSFDALLTQVFGTNGADKLPQHTSAT